MNFLAHLYLSGSSDEIVIGNFIGDAVKGNNYNKFNAEIKKGIILHRAIDHFTDKHPVVKKSKKRFQEGYAKYTGVVLDIVYDHLLAKNWRKFSPQNLNDFIKNSYNILLYHYFILPPKIKKLLPFIVVNNWLDKYTSEEGLKKVLDGMGRRTSMPGQSGFAIKILQANYSHFNDEFLTFFPELISFIKLDFGIDISYPL